MNEVTLYFQIEQSAMKLSKILFLVAAGLGFATKTVSALSPIRQALTTGVTANLANPSASTALGLSTLENLVSNQHSIAKSATLLILLNGMILRLFDDHVLQRFLQVEEPTATDKTLVRRIGRRFLALGAGAFNLFFLKRSPLTAIGASGAVLLLDRVKRSDAGNNRSGKFGHLREDIKSEMRGDRFWDVCRVHLYSVLAWGGVLHPLFPKTFNIFNRCIATELGWQAAISIFLPNRLEEEDSDETNQLCQASGYSLASLSAFIFALSTPQLKLSNANAMGLAYIANFYVMLHLSPVNKPPLEEDGSLSTP